MGKITAAESFEAEVVWLGLPRRNTIAVSIEMDRPVLSRTLHGFLLPHRALRSFLNVGAAAACKVAAEDAFDCLTTGLSISLSFFLFFGEREPGFYRKLIKFRYKPAGGTLLGRPAVQEAQTNHKHKHSLKGKNKRTGTKTRS